MSIDIILNIILKDPIIEHLSTPDIYHESLGILKEQLEMNKEITTCDYYNNTYKSSCSRKAVKDKLQCPYHTQERLER
jgi:hypothetical protein